MDRVKRRRTTIAALLVIMLLLGLGLFFTFNQSFDVRFQVDHGQQVANLRTNPRDTVSLEQGRFIPIRPGWTFTGWTRTAAGGGEYVTDTAPLRGNVTLFAQWERDTYLAQFFADGVRVYTRNIVSNTPITPAILDNPAAPWTISPSMETSFDTFFGWRFYDIEGNRAEIIRDNVGWWLYHFEFAYVQTGPGVHEWTWINSQRDGAFRRQITADAPLQPELYDLTFHAIVDQYRPQGTGTLQHGNRRVVSVFHHPNNVPTTMTESTPTGEQGIRFGRNFELPNIEMGASNAQVVGWFIDIPNTSTLFSSTDGIITSIEKFGHDVDHDMRVNDINRLNTILADAFIPNSSFELDPLLHFISTPALVTQIGLPGITNLDVRVINFRPILFGDVRNTGFAPASLSDERFFLRVTDEDGNVGLRAITSDSDVADEHSSAIDARLEDNGSRIVLLRPATRANMQFLNFQLFDGHGNETIIRLEGLTSSHTINVSDLNLAANRGLIINMNWELVENITINFDFAGNVNTNQVHFINDLNFNGDVRIPLTDRGSIVNQITTNPEATITLPSASMFAVARMSFSHWEFHTVIDGENVVINVGSSGQINTRDLGLAPGGTYTLRARWVDSRVNFTFNVNGGRNFTPDLSHMRGRQGESRNLPAQIPTRFGYTFDGWHLAGQPQLLGVEGRNTVTIGANRQVLTARWTPRMVRVELQYSYVDVSNVTQVPAPIVFNVPFDSSIQLRSITRPTYMQSVQHVGWRFADNWRGGNMDFAPTQTIRIDENFAVRVMGTTEEAALFPTNLPIGHYSTAIQGQDLKQGRQFRIDLWNNFAEGARLDHAGLFEWRSAISVVQGGMAVPVPRSYTVNRDFFVDRMTNNTQVTVQDYYAYRQLLATHDFAGFVYIPNSRAITLNLDASGAAGIQGLFNIENGSFDGGAGSEIEPYIFTFENNGTVTLPAPTDYMRLYKFWTPKEITINITAYDEEGGAAIANIPSIESYHGDRRARTYLTNDGSAAYRAVGETIDTALVNFNEFMLNSGRFAIHADERFTLWVAQFIYEINGVPYIVNTEILIEAGVRNPLNNLLLTHATPILRDGVIWPVREINLTRRTQNINTFIVRVENTHFGDSTIFGIADGGDFAFNPARGGSVISPIRTFGGIVDFTFTGGFEVDPNLRTLAAFHGHHVVGYSTVPNDNYANPTGQVFRLGMPIHFAGHGNNNPNLGHRSPGPFNRGTAFINAYQRGTITLFPIFELIQYRIYINMETDSGTIRRPIFGNHTIASGAFPLALDGFVGDSGAQFNIDRMSRFGYFVDFIPFNISNPQAGIANVGIQTQRNQFVLNRGLSGADQSGRYSLGLGSGINVRCPVSVDGHEINLWINWIPRQIFINHHFVQNNHWTMVANHNTGRTFGETFDLMGVDTLGLNTQRLGFHHIGWQVTHFINDDVGGITGGTHAFEMENLLLTFPVTSGNPGAGLARNLNDEFFLPPNINDNRLVINMFAWYQGIAMPEVHFLLRDRDEPEANVYYNQSNRTGQGPDNRFGAPFTWGPVGNLDINEDGNIIGFDENRYLLTLRGNYNAGVGHEGVRFGARIPVDVRIQEFGHFFWDGPNREYTDIGFAYWYYILEVDGEPFEQRIQTQVINGVHHFVFNDTRLINPLTNTFINNNLVIFPRFANLEYELFNIDNLGTAGSLSVLDQGEADILELIINNADVTQFSITSDDFQVLGAPIIQDDTTFTHFHNAINLNLYSAFIYGGGTQINISPWDNYPDEWVVIDNRFIRWGFELVGFAAYTNNGVATNPLVRQEFRQGDMFNHLYLIESQYERPTPVMLFPIWEAMNVELVFDLGNLPHSTPVTNFPFNGNLSFPSTHPSHVAGINHNITGSIVVPFETRNFSLPVFHTAADTPTWHAGFTWSHFENFLLGPVAPGSAFDPRQIDLVTGIGIDGTQSSNFPITPPRAMFDAITAQYDSNDPTTWTRIYLRADFSTASALSLNFHLSHRDGEGTDTLALNHETHAHTQTIFLRPEIDPLNPNRYLVDGIGQAITHFRLPTLAEFDNIPAGTLHGMRTFGWRFYGSGGAPNHDRTGTPIQMGLEGGTFEFINQTELIPGVINQNIYLVYDYVTGRITFDPNDGDRTPAALENVSHFDLINLPMDVRQHGYQLAGWTLAGHMIEGTLVPYTSVAFPSGRVFNNIDERFRAVFPRLPLSDPNAWYVDGVTIVLRAHWVVTPVDIIFRDDTVAANPITGPGFNNFTVNYNTYMTQSPNDPLPVPLRDGHSFVGWYTVPTHGMGPVDPGNPTPGRVNATTRVEQTTPINLHARFTANNFRFVFDANNPNMIGTLAGPRPASGETNGANTILHGGFVYNTTASGLLPSYETSPYAMTDPGGLRFLGWALDPMERQHIFDPNITTDVLLGNINVSSGNNLTEFTIDVATITRHAVAPQNPYYSRTFDIRLYAIWSVDQVHIEYHPGLGYGDYRLQTGYMFEGSQRTVIGGDNSATVGYGQAGFRTYGMMVFDDTGFERPGYNFVGWLPVHYETGLRFTSGPLNRIFYPGQFLPSVTEGFHMIAQWLAYSEDAFELTQTNGIYLYDDAELNAITPGTFLHPHFDGMRILSLPGETSTLFNTDYFQILRSNGGQLVTTADVVLFPRGLSVLPYESVVARNAIQINLPTYLDPTDDAGTGLAIAPRAIIARTLEILYINDALRGYNPETGDTYDRVFNIIAGEIENFEIMSSLREYRVTQGVLTLVTEADGSDTINAGIDYFYGQSEKYRYSLDAGTWGILYSRTHDSSGDLIAGTERVLIAFPNAGTMAGRTNAAIFGGVSVIGTYAFSNVSEVTTLQLRNSEIQTAIRPTGTGMRAIERRAFYHTSLTTMRLPNNAGLDLHHEFLSGFNFDLATITFGNDNSLVSNRAFMAGTDNRVLYFGDGTIPMSERDRDHIIFHTAAAPITGAWIIETPEDAPLQVNMYALSNLDFAATGILHINADIYLGTQAGLVFEHFMVHMQPTMSAINIDGYLLQSLDWRIVEELVLTNGMTITQATGNANTTILNASTRPHGQRNSFPIFVNTPELATQHQAASAMPRLLNNGQVSEDLSIGNSRFVTRNVNVIFNRGTTDNSGLAAIEYQETFAETFGNEFEIIALPSAFQFTGFAFIGWQVYGTTEIVMPGDMRRIGLVTNDQIIFTQGGTVVLVAQWAEVLVDFIGTGTNLEDINLTNSLRFFLANNDNTIGEEILVTDARMATPGTRIFIPGSSHIFNFGGTRHGFVGWAAEELPNTYLARMWTSRFWSAYEGVNVYLPTGTAESIHETQIPIFTLGADQVIFTALYEQASTGIEYLANGDHFVLEGGVRGLTARREGGENIGPNIHIPSAVQFGSQGFVRPVTHVANRGFWYPLNGSVNTVTNEIRIGEFMRNIGNQAFERTNATNLVFAVDQIMDNFIDPDTQLSAYAATLRDFVIGNNAFAYNYRLTAVSLPVNTTVIGTRAFLENFALTTVSLGFNEGDPIVDAQVRLATIGASAFERSRNLANFFRIPTTVSHIGAHAFTQTNIANFQTQNTVVLPWDGVWHGVGNARFGYVAIMGNLMLREFTRPDRLTLVVYAPGNTNANLNLAHMRGGDPTPDTDHSDWVIGHVADGAFSHHRHLRNIFIPSTIDFVDGRTGGPITLGHGVFAGMSRLAMVYMDHATPVALRGSNAAINPFDKMPVARILLNTITNRGTGIHSLMGVSNGTQNIQTWRTAFPEQSLYFTTTAMSAS
ncbi:MAG: InlB B-repeat-containing protein [Firmicutes bacterium]|nr:InlB B-repeat-containing protein [Bacillota bacterium]